MEILSTIFHTLRLAITNKSEGLLTDNNPYPIAEDSRKEGERILTFVDQYFLCEYVAIPKNFEVEYVLKMREKIGIFDIEGVNRKILEVIALSMRETPIIQLMNNARMNVTTGLYLLHIFQECDLIVKDIHNVFRQDYTRIIENIHTGHMLFLRGQETKNVNLIIFNIDLMRRKNFGEDALKKCAEMEKLLDEVTKSEKID